MIFESILNILTNLLFTLFNFLSLPHFPEAFTNGLNSILQYLKFSESIIAFFIPKGVTLLFPLFLTIFSARHGYFFVMWIIKKLPFAIN